MDKLDDAIRYQGEIIDFIRSVGFFRGTIDDEHLETKAHKVLELLKEQKEIIDKYRKADTFLAVHGWQWKDDGTEHYTEQLKDGGHE